MQNSTDFDPRLEENAARFANRASSNLFSGYLKWEFKDRESNRIPFSDGAYLGKKTVLSLGAGLEFQPRATQFLAQGDTVSSAMWLWAVDLFWDQPIAGLKETVFTLYMGYFYYDFGPNFSRNIGVNNPAVATRAELATFNGPGNAFPVVGTGNSWYTQAGFLLPSMRQSGQLQPYVAFQYSDFDRFEDAVIVYDLGVNWYLNGHLSKISLNIQNRPVFESRNGQLTATSRRSMAILQYLIRLE